MSHDDRLLVWLRTEVKTPPFSSSARVEAGVLLRRLQQGENPGMPHARPMPVIGRRCLELRIQGEDESWRIVCRVDTDAVIIAEVFSKKTQKTPRKVIETCRRRLREYDEVVGNNG